MADVDFTFISALEGGQLLKGYVPNAGGSQSGVTIATGFDLGARSKSDLEKLGLGPALVDQLAPYCGIKSSAAAAKLKTDPITITKADADAIDKASKGSALTAIEQKYDSAVLGKGKSTFKQLPKEAQTVITSVAFQYGDLKSRCPTFWGHVTKQDWVASVKELRAFGDAYTNRRNKEADLLEKVVKSGGSTPSSAAPKSGEPKNVEFSFPTFTNWYDLKTGGNMCKQSTLSAQVGVLVANHPEDVKLVKRLLNNHRPMPMMPMAITPTVDSAFLNAIIAFQRAIGMKAPDGVIDPGGHTWKHLNGETIKGKTPGQKQPAQSIKETPSGLGAPPQLSGDYWFPFTELTKWSWEEGCLRFGSDRSKKGGGKRAHAGCDLYYPLGTEIRAVGKGKVIEWCGVFYCQTAALVVDHGEFTVRYGEVQPKQMLKAGDPVEAGQVIGKVGLLVGISVKSPMLHFEMYTGKEKGSLTDTSVMSAKRADGVSFQRRKDLMDPTPYLNAWKTRRPT